MTCLHFVAIWKKDVNSGIAETLHWRALYESGIEIPPILQQYIPEGKSEQEVFWKEIEKNPIGWSRQLRKSIGNMMDLRIETLVSQNLDLRSQLHQLREDQEQMEKRN
ncbi:MAG: hypothetical protein IPL46_27930 [Saprospiraceae bacterium]|nr:hypothetical protein [Saprospiraceae bacterium]